MPVGFEPTDTRYSLPVVSLDIVTNKQWQATHTRGLLEPLTFSSQLMSMSSSGCAWIPSASAETGTALIPSGIQ